jgi:PadR family transcriptional regulator AphA
VSERALLPGEYMVLALLALRNMHGYDMMAFVADEGLMAVCPIEQSTLYTYLRNVEARGFVAWTEERVGNRPPRKTYTLTDLGRAAIAEWLRQPVARMREVRLEFLLKLYFLAEVDPNAHRELLAQQIVVVEEYLGHLDAQGAATPFEELVARSKRSAAEATLGWLKQYAYEIESG